MPRIIDQNKLVKDLNQMEKREIAIQYLMHSRHVINWIDGHARAYDMNTKTPEGIAFRLEKGRDYCEKLLRQ